METVWESGLKAFIVLLVVGCSSSNGGPNSGADDTETGTSAAAKNCGNGELDDAEICDGDEISCLSLSEVVYLGGTAPCNSTCSGYEVDKCEIAEGLNFEVAHGGADFDDGYSIVQTPDGGFIAVGYTMSFVDEQLDPMAPDFLITNSDLLAIKLDPFGAEEWKVHVGEKYQESATSIIRGPRGDYILAGSKQVVLGQVEQAGVLYDKIRSDGYLLAMDDSGEVLWSLVYGNAEDQEEFSQVIATQDSNVLACGNRVVHNPEFANDPNMPFPSSEDSTMKGYLIKTDPTGATIWEKTYSGPEETWDYFSSVAEVEDGYVAVGGTRSFGIGSRDVLVVKYDKASGEVIWQYSYPYGTETANDDYANHVAAIPDAQGKKTSVAVVGVEGKDYSYATNTADGNIRFITVDADGKLIKEHVYDVSGSGAGVDEGHGVIRVDGGYVMVASVRFDVYFNEYEESDVYLFKVGDDGEVEWERTYGKPRRYDYPESVVRTIDAGYAVIGSTQSFLEDGAALADSFYVIKTDANGLL